MAWAVLDISVHLLVEVDLDLLDGGDAPAVDRIERTQPHQLVQVGVAPARLPQPRLLHQRRHLGRVRPQRQHLAALRKKKRS